MIDNGVQPAVALQFAVFNNGENNPLSAKERERAKN